MHILLVRFSSMGDVVLQTATVNWLKSLLGKSLRITFVTSKEFAPLIEGHPAIQTVVAFDRRGESWSSLKKRLMGIDEFNPFDLIMDLHATMRSFKLKLAFWSIPSLTVDKRRWERFFLTKLKGKFFKRLIGKKVFGLEPQAERILIDLESIFDDNRAVRRTREFKNGKLGELTSLNPLPVYELPEKYIVVAPSASFFPKRWPIQSFVDLAKNIMANTEFHLVVLAGPGDNFCEAFNEIKSDRLINLQGKTSLKESMSIISRSLLCVGNDSGMNHIAEAYGVPCLTIFGPTDPRFGFAPHGDKSHFISKELWCKPCSTTGSGKCFRDRLYCMEEISVSEVREKIDSILGGEQIVG
jgi:ADP-heptose:LPS heptosyltransferase